MALTKVFSRMIAGDSFNVKDYGAKGDGVTDDSAAIQAAIDACMSGPRGGAVEFPFSEGEEYAITSTLLIDYTRVGTQTNMVWLRGTGMPDRNTAGVVLKNQIIWTGAAGGVMLTLTDPLDHKFSDIGFNGNDVADYCVTQNNSQGGWGGTKWDNVVLEKAAKNCLRYSGAVDGGRNVWTNCTMRKGNALNVLAAQNALVQYNGANNVNDQYVNSEFIYTISGTASGSGFYINTGSPDVYLTGCFTKAETSFNQSNSTGAAYFSATNCYAEGDNFYVSAKQVDQRQDFVNVRHAGSGGDFVNIVGNSSGKPLNIVGGFSNGDITVTGRDDFPIILEGFDLRSGSISLDTSIGSRTNLIEIGRVSNVANTSSWIASMGYISRIPTADTDATLNVNVANGSVFYASRTGGLSVAVSDPSNVTATEDDGAGITIIIHANGASAVTVTWGTDYKFAGASAPSSVTGNRRTILKFINIGGVWYETSRSENIG